MNYFKDFGSFWKQLRTISRDILLINKKKAVAILAGKSLSALLPLIQIYLIKLLVDLVTTQTASTKQLPILLICFGLTQILMSMLSQITSLWENSLQQEVSDQFGNRIIDKTFQLEYAVLEEPALQNSLFLAQQQSRLRVNQLLPALYNTFSAALSMIFLVILFVGLKAYFFLLILLLALPITIHKWILGKKASDLEFTLAPKERESQYLFQVLTGLPWAKESRTFEFRTPFQTQFTKIREWIRVEKNKIQQSGIKQGLFIEVIEVCFMVGILVHLSINTLDANMSVGFFILYLQGVQRLQSSSKTFFQSLLQLFQLRTFVKDLYAFLALPEKNNENQTEEAGGNEGVKVENLFFAYPHAAKPVLKNISLNARKGEIVAIVGENGSGKSTLVKLLAVLYEPQEGKILFNGNKIEKESGSFLFQDFQRYQYSAESNIHFSLTPSQRETEAAKSAAAMSSADEFIHLMARGYQTNLGNLHQGSTDLSGGQWQKLALARIFYQKKSLVVLDEPSSALDAFAELDLYQNIRAAFSDNIVILISHRLYNLKLADRIYVMQDGSIVDEGSFQELISREGLFKSMYDKQKI